MFLVYPETLTRFTRFSFSVTEREWMDAHLDSVLQGPHSSSHFEASLQKLVDDVRREESASASNEDNCVALMKKVGIHFPESVVSISTSIERYCCATF